MDKQTQQFIAGAPINVPGPAKCGNLESLEARFEIYDQDTQGDIYIEQTGFDLYTIEICALVEGDINARSRAHGVLGADVVDTMRGLLLETVPDVRAALNASFCHGQSHAWSLIRDVALERIVEDERMENEKKFARLEDVSF